MYSTRLTPILTTLMISVTSSMPAAKLDTLLDIRHVDISKTISQDRFMVAIEKNMFCSEIFFCF
jgi:hypothetical protein